MNVVGTASTSAGKEDIGGLQVAVQNLMLMHVGQSAAKLVEPTQRRLLGEPPTLLAHLLQSVL